MTPSTFSTTSTIIVEEVNNPKAEYKGFEALAWSKKQDDRTDSRTILDGFIVISE